MSSIIQVENLSKSFIISHEGKEQYTALRDVISRKAKRVFSFPLWMKPSEKMAKEEFWALKDINFEIEQGERVGIIGRNGAGKSTLLKILSRITDISTGTIKVKGRVASLLEVGTGFHPELTGRENIFLNGAILGMSREEIRRQFDAIVDFAEVERFLDTPVKRYSSGMYVRLAFAVAAHLEPEILIIDEVLAVGDAQFQKKCLGKMEDVSINQGRTVLFVSHNMGIVSQLCNRGVFLSKGSVFQDGPIKTTIDKYLMNDSMPNYYEAPVDIKKDIYFKQIRIVNIDDGSFSNFSFDESIKINFNFNISGLAESLQIGIALKDKYSNRVFTIIKNVDFFKTNDSHNYKGSVILPSRLIAPNNYSFVFALWTKSGHIYELLDGICPITIHDSGTELALYEGVDYGNVIIEPTWINQ